MPMTDLSCKWQFEGNAVVCHFFRNVSKWSPIEKIMTKNNMLFGGLQLQKQQQTKKLEWCGLGNQNFATTASCLCTCIEDLE